MISNTIGGLELAYTIVAFIGFVFNFLILEKSLGDYYYVIEQKVNGMRKYAAITSILIFLGGTIIQSSYTIVGIVAMTQPATHEHATWANYTVAAIFITSSCISAAFAGIIYSRRIRIVEMIEAQLALDSERRVQPNENIPFN